MDNLENALHDLKSTSKIKKIYGILGIPINGQRTVEVPNREGFVYVRLRDNPSELIQAINSEVSPVYDLPVVLVREGNRYKIEGRDTERYQTWGSFSSFIPRHGEQHSFLEGTGGGGDITWVDGKQFMPMLVMPSGSLGSNNVVVSDYRIQDGSTGWIYSGGTGTPNLLMYKPLNGDAVMILVYVDQTTGNPGFLVGSGSYFANTITGSAQVNPYIPANPNSNYLPAMAVRLSSGTSVIGWDNLYDVRQYYGGSGGGASTGSSFSGIPVQDEGVPQGTGTVFNFVGPNVDVSVSGSVIRVFVTGSAGSSLPPFITGSVPYAGSDGILKEDNPKFSFDESRSTLWIGQKYSPPFTLDDFRLLMRATGTNTPAAMGLIVAGTGTSGGGSPSINGYRSRGTFETPTPVGEGDALLTIIGAGFDGFQYQNAARMRFYANRNFVTGTYLDTRIDFEVTPSGSATRIPKMVLYGDSLNLINTGTYNINGVPHTHNGREVLTANRTYYVRTDGSDSNTGMADTAGGAFLTIQKAVDTVAALDRSTYTATIQVRSGTYTGAISITGWGPGSSSVEMIGDTTTPGNVILSVAGDALTIQNYAVMNIGGFKITTSAGSGGALYVKDFATLNITGKMEFGACNTLSILVRQFANISISADATISGGSVILIGGSEFARISAIANVTWTLTGTPAFSAMTVRAEDKSYINVTAITFSGGATGKRYESNRLSEINTNGGGATKIPGNSNGTTSNGGIYV